MHELIALVIAHGAWLVFVVTFAARLGVPVPAAPLLVIAGALAVGSSNAAPGAAFSTFGLAIVANILGDAAWFWAGRRHGYKVLRLLCRISISPDSCVRQSETFITRWGGASLIAAKFLPGVSVVAPPMAGALGMSALAFLGWETLAAAIWAGALMGVGVVFSAQIQQVLAVLSALGVAALEALAAAAAAYLVYLAWRTWRRRVFLRAVAMSRIDVADLRALLDGGREPLIIDVRSDGGRAIDARRIPGAIAVALGEIEARLPALRDLAGADREIVLYCNCPNEASAALAARTLAIAGFSRVRPLAGGLEAWVAAGHATEVFSPSPQGERE
jgi:membrane protein DedA with SNARE-associated domain/rhodanese-related sulfurtransferase